MSRRDKRAAKREQQKWDEKKESDSEGESSEPEVVEVPQEPVKKRGRGRPPKNPKPIEVEESDEAEPVRP
jgi:hypothetical protein